MNIRYQTFIGHEQSLPHLHRCLTDAELLESLGPNRDIFAKHVQMLLKDDDVNNRPSISLAVDSATDQLLGVKTFTTSPNSIGGGWTAVKTPFRRRGICTNLDHEMARAAAGFGIEEIHEMPATKAGESYLDNSPYHEVNVFGVYVRRVANEITQS